MAAGGLLAQYRQLYSRMEQAWRQWCELQVSAAIVIRGNSSRCVCCSFFQWHPVRRSSPLARLKMMASMSFARRHQAALELNRTHASRMAWLPDLFVRCRISRSEW